MEINQVSASCGAAIGRTHGHNNTADPKEITRFAVLRRQRVRRPRARRNSFGIFPVRFHCWFASTIGKKMDGEKERLHGTAPRLYNRDFFVDIVADDHDYHKNGDNDRDYYYMSIGGRKNLVLINNIANMSDDFRISGCFTT
ncbi:hypothetical protein GWI33_014713 [Rhynchophorus ferrugineus]|uniref:Uncharacterized protein n=1 Tax=Rhynchophorus ferrugineus TaxID=354439 RepID=A0A834M578_RHYFE|nr:hypothetical protein GWI33_014713 [Rhynchophorus ferrugineus]